MILLRLFINITYFLLFCEYGVKYLKLHVQYKSAKETSVIYLISRFTKNDRKSIIIWKGEFEGKSKCYT